MNGEFSQGEFQGKVLQKLENIEASLDKKVDRDEFVPLKNLAYGFASIVLLSVIGALVAGVVKALN